MSRTTTPEKSGRQAAVLLLLFAVFAGTLAMLAGKIHSLERQLARERRLAQADIAERDAVNRQLEKELDLLGNQAVLTEWRMAELEQLERELRRAADRALAVASRSGVQIAGGGGQFVAYHNPESLGDAEDIGARFAALIEKADDIRQAYRQTLSAVRSLDAALRHTPILWPADSRQINSPFGFRRDPFTGKAAHHNGIDIDGEEGEPVYASADGIVESAGDNGPHGLQIVIRHNDRYATVYSHLGAIRVEAGQAVKQGEPIGEIGSSGRSTGPHLHYEILLDGVQVDPQDFLLFGREELEADHRG